MGCCEYCAEGPIKFCHLCETTEGALKHWEMVKLWYLNGLFPCDYDSPTYEWVGASENWWTLMENIASC